MQGSSNPLMPESKEPGERARLACPFRKQPLCDTPLARGNREVLLPIRVPACIHAVEGCTWGRGLCLHAMCQPCALAQLPQSEQGCLVGLPRAGSFLGNSYKDTVGAIQNLVNNAKGCRPASQGTGQGHERT